MISINLAGVSFTNPTKLALETKQQVIVRHHKEYDDNERALGVHTEEGKLIGWIPKLETLQKYINKFKEENNETQMLMHSDRKVITESLRDNIETDMFRNHINVMGTVSRLRQDYDTGEVYSVSVSFDYM